MMEVVSPTRVAAPCRFGGNGNGDDHTHRIDVQLFADRRVHGCHHEHSGHVVDKGGIAPAKEDMLMVTHMTLGHLSKSISAIRFGIWKAMKKSTRIMVPEIIRSTFQLITDGRFPRGRDSRDEIDQRRCPARSKGGI